MALTTPAPGPEEWNRSVSSPLLAVKADYAAIAAEQYGLVTNAQLAGLGVSPGGIHRRVQARALIRMLPGVFRLAGVPRSWHQRAMSVYLWAGETSAIGGTAAAALHRLDGCALPSAITVWTERSLKSPNPLVIVRRSRGFDTRSRQVIDRIGATGCARTLIDISAEVGEARLELALEDARRRRLVTPASLDSALAKLPPNQPGRGKLLKVLAATAQQDVAGQRARSLPTRSPPDLSPSASRAVTHPLRSARSPGHRG